MRIEILKQSNEIEVSDNETRVRIKMEHQLMQILALLTESRGEMVDKKAFIDKIWDGNNFTGEGALTKNIFKLRELLKNNNLDKIIQIETIPKKGYRLLMNEHNAAAKNSISNKKAILASAAAVIIIYSAFFIYRSNQHPASTPPLININGQDTIIQIGDKKAQVINIDSGGGKVITLENE